MVTSILIVMLPSLDCFSIMFPRVSAEQNSYRASYSRRYRCRNPIFCQTIHQFTFAILPYLILFSFIKAISFPKLLPSSICKETYSVLLFLLRFSFGANGSTACSVDAACGFCWLSGRMPISQWTRLPYPFQTEVLSAQLLWRLPVLNFCRFTPASSPHALPAPQLSAYGFLPGVFFSLFLALRRLSASSFSSRSASLIISASACRVQVSLIYNYLRIQLILTIQVVDSLQIRLNRVDLIHDFLLCGYQFIRLIKVTVVEIFSNGNTSPNSIFSS